MSEFLHEPAVESLDEAGTGNPDVDVVVSTLRALDGLPVDEHVAVFEKAHESLRRTLVGAGQDGRVDPWAPDRS